MPLRGRCSGCTFDYTKYTPLDECYVEGPFSELGDCGQCHRKICRHHFVSHTLTGECLRARVERGDVKVITSTFTFGDNILATATNSNKKNRHRKKK